MTRDEIRDEVFNGPLAAELATPFLGDDAAVKAILNRKDRPGYIPARHLIAALASALKWGIVELAVRHRVLPDGSPCPSQLYMLFAAVHLAAYGQVSPPLRFAVDVLTSGISTLVGVGLLSQGDSDAILAGEIKVSRAQERWGLDAEITLEMIGAAR